MIIHIIYPYYENDGWHFDCPVCSYRAVFDGHGYRVIAQADSTAVHKSEVGDRRQPQAAGVGLPGWMVDEIEAILARLGW